MLIAQRPTLTEDVISDTRSRFIIEPHVRFKGEVGEQLFRWPS